MESTKEFFDSWFKSSELAFESMTEMAREFQKSVWRQDLEGGGMSGLRNLYDSWTTAVMNGLGEKDNLNTNFIRNTFAKTLNSSNVYAKLYEIWLPFLKSIQDKSINLDTYKDLTDPAKYKEALDAIFGFEPGSLSESSAESMKVFETLFGSMKEFMKPWTEASEKNIKAFPQFAGGHPESFFKVFNNFFHAFDSTFGRIFRIPAVGKDREKIELMLKCFDEYSLYLGKSIEYKQLMYATGLTSMGKVVETIVEKIKSGEEMAKFEDFFNLWIEVNEKNYLALFQTEEFSMKQGELLEADLNVRKHFSKLMELYLYDFPVALRSEMDDLYKTIYELKKKVKNLEKQIQVPA
ncbi:MAG: poly(R)-hydroxyalkanoic acid synthase subunit PhaE [Nitrospiria bacterium]